jgi:hypothetical protein
MDNTENSVNVLRQESEVKTDASTAKTEVKAKPKKKRVKATKSASGSIISCHVYPNKGKHEIDTVKANISGKDKEFKALTKHDIDIKTLKLSPVIIELFCSLTKLNNEKYMFSYKNVYGYAFGITPKGFNSYKSVITHHNTDGNRSLIVNANKHFGIDHIVSTIKAFDLSYEHHKTYIKMYVTKENLKTLVKACKQLLGIKG